MTNVYLIVFLFVVLTILSILVGICKYNYKQNQIKKAVRREGNRHLFIVQCKIFNVDI